MEVFKAKERNNNRLYILASVWQANKKQSLKKKCPNWKNAASVLTQKLSVS